MPASGQSAPAPKMTRFCNPANSYVYTDRSTQTECRGVSNWEADR